jgi:carbamoyl-phosphate synthase large subunit
MNIAVTGMNAVDIPGPGVAVARCIKDSPKWKGRIIGLAYDALEPGILDCDLVKAAYLLPYPKAGRNALLEKIIYVHQKEHLDAIVPTLDSEMTNFISIESDLASMGIKMLLPTESQFTKRSKVNLPKLSDAFGIKTPETHLITHIDQISVIKEKFPFVVKGVFYDARIAYSMDEAVRHAHQIAAKWGYPILVQRKIAGEEFKAAAVGDGKGGVAGMVCMKKIVLTDKGKGWACVSIKNDRLMEFTKKIVGALKWRGALEVEAIYSESEGAFYLIEINPRFPSWIYLAKATGVNLPYMLLRMALGLKRPPSKKEYDTGIVFTNYTVNLITDLTKIQTLYTAREISYEKTL